MCSSLQLNLNHGILGAGHREMCSQDELVDDVLPKRVFLSASLSDVECVVIYDLMTPSCSQYYLMHDVALLSSLTITV